MAIWQAKAAARIPVRAKVIFVFIIEGGGR
jgi:hypothetical protein